MQRRISISDASKLFKLTYSAMFRRTQNGRYGYPTLHYDENHTPYYLEEECLQIAQFEQKFFQENVLLIAVSKLCFDRTYFLNRQYKKGRLKETFTVKKFNGQYYIPLKEFETFYNDVCERQTLIPFAQIKRHIDMPYAEKLLYFLQITGFWDIPYFCFLQNEHKIRRFYKKSDVNDYFARNSIELIK